jgi:hypothetical protein
MITDQSFVCPEGDFISITPEMNLDSLSTQELVSLSQHYREIIENMNYSIFNIEEFIDELT